MSRTKFVTFVFLANRARFAARGRAIYYPSHEASEFSHCHSRFGPCICPFRAGSRGKSAGLRTHAEPEPGSGQASAEELVDQNYSAAANFR
jgi:hypothetical protein